MDLTGWYVRLEYEPNSNGENPKISIDYYSQEAIENGEAKNSVLEKNIGPFGSREEAEQAAQ